MDEPLSDLDAKLKIEIRKEIQRVHRRINKPTIYVTHDQEEALTMSDRIAIMNNGILEQIGTRDEVYNYPENIFVAQFIGNPSINEITSTLLSCDEDGGTLNIYGSELTFETDLYTDIPTPLDVIAGVRPQSVTLTESTEQAEFKGELMLLEPVDDRALARVEGPEAELRALIPSETDLKTGDTVGITFETDNLYLFDSDTEELLIKSH
jgi:multiple sugar transport system ATP-binding protein